VISIIPELTAKPCQLTVDEKTVAANASYTTARDSTVEDRMRHGN